MAFSQTAEITFSGVLGIQCWQELKSSSRVEVPSLSDKQNLVDQSTWAANGARVVVMGTACFAFSFVFFLFVFGWGLGGGCGLGFICPTVTNRQKKKRHLIHL